MTDTPEARAREVLHHIEAARKWHDTCQAMNGILEESASVIRAMLAFASTNAGEGALERAEAAQLNLYHQAERDRERARRSDEAFDLIAPFVAKFAATVPHYAGGRPRYEGSTFAMDAEPGYRPVLTTACSGLTGNGVPPDGPTIADLRLLADAYQAAREIRNAPPTAPAIEREGVSREVKALAWTEPHASITYPEWRAQNYSIRFEAVIDTSRALVHGKYPLAINGRSVTEKFDTLESAKQYAQNNYAERILSALSPITPTIERVPIETPPLHNGDSVTSNPDLVSIEREAYERQLAEALDSAVNAWVAGREMTDDEGRAATVALFAYHRLPDLGSPAGDDREDG